MYEKRGKGPTQHRPDVPSPLPIPEPLIVNRSVAPKVKNLVHAILRHENRLAKPDVTTVVLHVRDAHVTIKLTSDLMLYEGM